MAVRGGVSRRALVLYLGAIVGPTLVLLFLGLQSVYRQRQALDHLTLANLRLSGERAATAAEQRVRALVDECIRDPRVAAAARDAASFEDPLAARKTRAALEAVKRTHPLVAHLFMLDGGRVRYPLLRSPFPTTLDALVQQEPPGSRAIVAARFAEADREEAAGATAAAAGAYARTADAASIPGIRAVARLREARCRSRLRESRRAIQLYASVATTFPDEFDASWRPAALTAGLERLNLLAAAGEPTEDAAARLRADLLQGRWEVSSDQLEYFDAELARFAPAAPREDAFARELRLAQAFEQQFQPAAVLHPLDLHPFPFQAANVAHAAYYALSGEGESRPLVAFVLDRSRVAEVVRDSARRAGVAQDVSLASRRQDARPDGSRLDVTFPDPAFRFWTLSIAAPTPLSRLSRDPRDLLLYTGATLLIMTVLVLGVVLLVRDVARESELNRLRGDFVSGVSHELKTPLTVIRLYAENLLDDPDAPATVRRRSYEVLTRESERLTRLIDRVLRFSRAEEAGPRYSFAPIQLASLVRDLLGVYGPHLQRRGFSLAVAFDEEAPAVNGDADAIAEAVVNLLDNAAKYSGDAREIGVRVERRNDTVVVEVRDHGVGIEAAERARIFDRFYRSPGTGKGGYGLGLFLVAETMTAHGGRVELDTEAGRGSTFRLVFPAVTSGHAVLLRPLARGDAASGGLVQA